MITLFEKYPELKEKLPYVSLADLPTPVRKLENLGREIGVEDLYIKQDGVSGKAYGGNKIRKLEFLLGEALRDNKKEVMTFGAVGSNHATATAIFAKQVGLRSISMLLPQPNAYYIRKNLLMSCHSGAEFHHYSNMNSLNTGTYYQSMRHKAMKGVPPQIIPMGGSAPLGIIGFVNAALELKEQVAEGKLPEPDLIYVACGSMGTTIGLTLGVKVAGLKTRVIPVRVASTKSSNKKKFLNLLQQTNALLHSADPSFPKFPMVEDELVLRSDFAGKTYALFTKEGMQAIRLMGENEGTELEGTYTGKALAALIHDAESGDIKDKVVLFWNTLNSRNFSDAIKDIDYRQLPKPFHKYFIEEVQPLDR